MIKTKPNTRERILELLKKEVSLSVNDLTERLNITHMAVRKHLAILENDELIKSTEIKQTMGRPLLAYSLTDKGDHAFPKNYEGITVEFLKDIEEIHGEEAINLLFEKREYRLTQEYKNRMHQKTTSEKIEEIVKIQNEKGYMASVNKLDDGTFELIEYNCPIYSIAREFKTACRCETEMFKTVLETEHVRRVSCKTEGDHHCKFKLKLDS